ncbi:sn-glycerol-3-phosphate ABC transporter ATP-binding protein UgpC [Undibacterium sp. Jales W-56]|uniref:ABC transporter ATP-binding protein n=1 Tax=Undibacterium sp. Jales W-56 TaxID=2897325 RepID=UPI0021D218C7|nr:sn-glycerol-3-phosphate ABC transporter ATP-binding protein UgpC [Undibacterium sp. Jales W-56]MCU6435557.1 sn-glycerol-3-phosphate ABC transporter ATP-binding protein UgpC [Undibacterium sp. Jales W-56]
MAQVRLRNITKHYSDTKVIHGIDLDVQDGEFMVFVGPSGCGKSTLLRMIAGLEDITDGELLIAGQRANDIPPAKRGLAMVFQSYALYPHMSVYDNMAFSLKMAGQKKQQVDEAVQQAAQILQISHLLLRKPKDLSGGQRQRVAIGRAIVRQPKLFLFDEPLSNLDASLRVQMRIELSRLHQELKTTMIYVTHDQVEAMTLGQRIVVFNAGKIEQLGTPLELYERPANLFVAGFLGAPKMNFLSAEVMALTDGRAQLRLIDGSNLTLPVQEAQIQAGDTLTLGIRAEQLSLPLEKHQSAATHILNLNVDFVEHLGDASVIYGRLENDQQSLAMKLSSEVCATLPALKPGSRIAVMMPLSRCHLFDASGQACRRWTS